MQTTVAPTLLPRPEEGEAAFEAVYPILVEGLRRSLYARSFRRARSLRIPRVEHRLMIFGVANETLTRAWHDRGGYDPERAPFTWWLFMLGRKLLARELRTWERQLQAVEQQQGQLLEEGPEKRHGTKGFRLVLERDRLGRALLELPQDQVQALSLYYLLDLTLEEVSRVMGRTPDAVESLVRRGRQNARARLEGVAARRRGRPRKGGSS